MRGATVLHTVEVSPDIISIHAPHARSDVEALLLVELIIISIHAPHARSDLRPFARANSA